MINYAVIRKESLRSFFWLTFFGEFGTVRKENCAIMSRDELGMMDCMYKEK